MCFQYVRKICNKNSITCSSNLNILAQGNWQTFVKPKDIQPLLCVTNTWLFEKMLTSCFSKGRVKKTQKSKYIVRFI